MSAHHERIQVAGVHKITVLPTGHGQRREHRAFRHVMVDVLCVTGDDAPVAATGDVLGTLRFHDGRLFAPILNRAGGAPLSLAEYAECAGGRNRNFHGPIPTLGNMGFAHVTPREEVLAGARKVLADNFADADLNAQRGARDLLVVDGVVHRAAKEPTYAINLSQDPKLTVNLHQYAGPASVGQMSLKYPHLANAVCARLARMKNLAPADETGRIEIIIPEAFTFDDLRHAVTAGARAVISATREVRLGDLPIPSLEALLSLRRMEEGDFGTSREGLAMSIAAMEKLLSSLESSGKSTQEDYKRLGTALCECMPFLTLRQDLLPDAAHDQDADALASFAP